MRKGRGNVVLLSYEGWLTLLWRRSQGGWADAAIRRRSNHGYRRAASGRTRFPRITLAPNIASGALRATMVFAPLTPSDWDLSAETGNFNYAVIARLKERRDVWRRRAPNWRPCRNAYTVSAHLPIHLGIALTPLASDVTAGISAALWLDVCRGRRRAADCVR
jgi:hypothetical protein